MVCRASARSAAAAAGSSWPSEPVMGHSPWISGHVARPRGFGQTGNGFAASAVWGEDFAREPRGRPAERPAWCITAFTPDNGPLRVIPGSHRVSEPPIDMLAFGVGHGPAPG
jgi:Phytanoyl-CoA dioxygenase (PhyH)